MIGKPSWEELIIRIDNVTDIENPVIEAQPTIIKIKHAALGVSLHNLEIPLIETLRRSVQSYERESLSYQTSK